jgi:pimeloyl-ACP methyl ester carboxylesterase
VAPTLREIDVRGTPVRVQGDGDGPPLVFLHGAGAGGRWLGFQEALARRFTVICPVHPGHGGTAAADWIEEVADLAFLYLDLLDTLALDRAHLVGASLGGWIAAEMAVMASSRLRSLVLVDPVGIKVEGWIYPFLFGMELPEVVATIFHRPEAALALAPADQSLDTLVELYRQNAALARVSWNPYLYNPRLRRRLGRIAAPTLLVWGEHDRLAPLVCADAWRKEIPGARLLTFARSGHVPHLEEPQAVAAAVAEFCGAAGTTP